MEKNKKEVPWTPEIEQRYQYVQKQYDNSRVIGMDVLKILLGTTITIAAVPIVFFDKVRALFVGKSIALIYFSWIFIILALLLGFWAYLFVFEGYYHQAHLEASRWLNGDQNLIEKYNKKSNKLFDLAHLFGIGSAISFGISLLCIVILISYKIFCLLSSKT